MFNVLDVLDPNPRLRWRTKQWSKNTAFEACDEVVVNPSQELPERDATWMHPRREYDPHNESQRDGNPQENPSHEQERNARDNPDGLSP